MSDSESEIDEPKPTRRKIIKKNFTSDSDDNEMSPQPGCSRSNQTKQLSSSDCETDDSDDSELFNSDSDNSEKNDSNWSSYESELDETGEKVEEESKSKNNKEIIIVNEDAGTSSDSSSSSSSESCPICLLTLKNQEIGIPEICEHKFCFICIQEWSNNVTTCPIDRKGFTKIIVKDNVRDMNTLRSVPVEVKSTSIDLTEEDLTQCEICNQTDREDSMLLCDNCNNGYHMDCLNPPLEEVPFGSWYCDCCFSPHNSEESEDDINALITDAMDMGNLPSSRFRARSNQNAERRVRTRQSQRILSAIISRLARRSYDPDQPSTSNSATLGNQIIRRVRRVANTRKTTKRRKTKRRTRRTRTEVVEYEANMTGEKFPIKSKRIYKKRRKTKRKRKTSKKVKCRPTSSRRSAINPNSSSAVASLDIKKSDAGVPRLHIFGNHNQLDYFSDSDGTDGENSTIGRGLGSSGIGGTMLATSVIRARLGGRNMLNRRKAINLSIEATPPDSTTSSIDILGDILQTQERWHSLNRGNNLSRVTITNDGSLIPDKVDDKKIIVTEAPMYPRNEGNQGNRFYNNSNNRYSGGGGGGQQGGGGGGNNQRNSYGGADSSGNYNQFRPRQFNNNFQANNSFGGNDFSYRGSQNRGRSFRGRNSQNPQNQQNSNRFQHQQQQNQQNYQQNRQQESTSSNNDQITSSTNENSIKIPNENISELYDPEDVESTPPPAQSQIEVAASISTQNEIISKHDENDVNDDDDDDDDCPNFSLYSAESMDIAKESDGTAPSTINQTEDLPPDEFEEKEEDLVQQGDDEDDEEEIEEEVEHEEEEPDKKCDSPSSTTTNVPSIPLPDSEPISKPDKQKTTSTEKNKKNILELYDDSDWEEWNNEKTDEDKSSELQKLDEEEEIEIPVNKPEELATESISDDERSYTPCLDENKQRIKSTDENPNDVKIPEEENENGIFGLDTEAISDEDEGVFNDETASVQPKIDEIIEKEKEKEKDDPDNKFTEKTTPPTTSKQSREKRSDKSNRKKDEEFKKLSKNTKERNYRDKDKDKDKDKEKEKDKGRKRSRSRSNDKENRERRMKNKRRGKRKDLERYDVRNLIADRVPRSSKDEYGRDLSRPLKSKSRSGSRGRRSLSNRRRRTISPRRSPDRRGSYSRRRSMSPRKIRKSRSRRRSPPPQPQQPVRRISRSPPLKRSVSRTKIPARKRSRSASLWSNSKTPSLSRSRSNSLDKNNKARRKPDDKRSSGKRKEKKRRSSKTNKRARRSISKVWESPKQQQSSWSRSPSIEPTTNEVSWTPPVAQQNSENLTVIFKNKEAVAKARKKEKKKRLERKKGQQSRRERKKRNEKTQTQTNSPAAPSKEVFTSGDNILVSVSFNKNQDQPQQTTVVTLPASRDQIITKRRTEEQNPKKVRRNRLIGKRHKKIDAKPVAIIDLDNSPFKELTPSPKAIIILSDSENEAEEKDKQAKEIQNKEPIIIEDIPERLEQVSQPQSPTIGTTFNMIQLTGPKTPPEPTSVKFSMSVKSKQSKVRPINPLHDVNDDDNQIEQPDDVTTNKIDEVIIDNQLMNKIGPNTPPDPILNSPDAYDPFEPTKSASNSPIPADTSTNGNLSDCNVVSSMDASIDDNQLNLKDKPMNPVDLVMSLIHNKSHQDLSNTSIDSFLNNSIDNQNDLTNQSSSPNDNQKSDEHSKNINVLSQIILQSGSSESSQQQQQQRNLFLQPTVTTTTTSTRSPAKSSQTLTTTTKPSPMKQQTSTNISKLPLPQKSSQNRNTGIGDDMELESPYSPGSSDYDDLFEPPPEMGKNSASTPKGGQKSGKNSKESFDVLFGGSPQQGRTRRGRRQKKQCVKVYSKSSAGNGSLAKDENQLKILDDLPSSAVELQVKDKFLRKLNRQERVVEEVKLVLKPHYNKKHISKEEYKDVLRKAVPKICHNRTGEINPSKIQSLIEAYVKRIRRKSKSSSSK